MKRGDVDPTISPSMDIQVSSNFERYLYFLLGGDSKKLEEKMSEFSGKGEFHIEEELFSRAKKDFTASRCSEEETLNTIRMCYEETGYLVDPHTAVGLHAAMSSLLDPDVPVVSLACAHPSKFPDAVEKATGIRPELPGYLCDLMSRPEFLTPLDNDLERVKAFISSNV
jgi:threonine synthase